MKLRERLLIILSLSAAVALNQSCAGGASGTSPAIDGLSTRPFKMGFSPWPWDATQAAVDWTWNVIFQNAEIISLHTEEGVPWNEALNNQPFPQSFQATLNDRKT